MRQQRSFGALSAAFLLSGALNAQGQNLIHEKIASGFLDAQKGVISPRGFIAFGAQRPATAIWDVYKGSDNLSANLLGNRNALTALPYPIAFDSTGRLMWVGTGSTTDGGSDLFLDTANYSKPILGASGARSVDGVGFNLADEPVWTGTGALNTPNYDLFVSATPVSAPILGSNRSATGIAVSKNGMYVLWEGSGSATGNLIDVFRDNVNLSAVPLGGNSSGRYAAGRDINNVGTVLWEGAGVNTGNFGHVFRSLGSGVATDISKTRFGSNSHFASAADLNEANQVAWTGEGGDGTTDAFRDNVNLSETVSPGADRFNFAVGINSAGNVLWQGANSSDPFYNFDVYVDATNYSRNALGANGARSAEAFSIANSGFPLWRGSGDNTGTQYHLFYGSVNLTKAVYGSAGRDSDFIASNEAGQMLWMATETDGTRTIWLSTPRQTVSLSGIVNLDSYTHPENLAITLSLREPATDAEIGQVTIVPDASGQFNLLTNFAGYYNLRFSAPGFLARRLYDVPMVGSVNLNFTLINGDTNGDNKVDDFDLFALTQDFLGAPNQNGITDLNGDGAVDDFDLFDMTSHFLEVGD